MTTADNAGTATRALIFALVALACGHMLSTLLRTIARGIKQLHLQRCCFKGSA
ncbi:hypothetical protein I6F20_19810 [Bradyrhizobium sp. IC3123]|uniref:hypothetical protein n=1 Tax=Bradyrhizobium sp. IC3123 TaxID=2793803 RepID=UPI001CD80F3E|nr:hypothetical protein [Bradyrhizobium sp. IC3123]MCA1391321.1 hypothetical protein [Bradyrhizobium sp. IC3123]